MWRKVKRKNIEKSLYTLDELRRGKRKAKHKYRKRIQVIILFHKRKRVEQICEYLDISKPTVYTYIDKFNNGGLDELIETHYNERGRKPKLTQSQQDKLKEIIRLSPQEIGFGESINWNTRSIAEYINETYDVKMTRSGVREMLVRNRMSYTRPTYVLAKADPEKQELFSRNLEKLKKI